MTWRQMIAVGVRRVVLARGELDKLEGPGYAARRARAATKGERSNDDQREQGSGRRRRRRRTRQRRATRQRKKRQGRERRESRVGRPRDGMEGCCRANRRETAKRDRKRRTPKGGRRLAHHTPLLKIPVWWRRAVLPSASLPWVVRALGVRFLSLFFLLQGSRDTLPWVLRFLSFFH